MTTAGVALGTPAYMSPEQATADPHIDHRADIYAIGALAYELLAGRAPFVGATPQAILAAQVTEQAEPVSRYRDQVSAELEAVVMECLAKKPADRFQTAEEILPYLESMATSAGLTPTATVPLTAVSGPARFLNPKVLAGVAVLAVIGVFGSRMISGDPLDITTSNRDRLTTNPGLEYLPDISPDGNDVVYLGGGLDTLDLFVRNVEGGNPFELAPDLPGSKVLAKWSSNGQTVQFRNCPTRLAIAGGVFDCPFYEVSRMGGTVSTISREAFFASDSGLATIDSRPCRCPRCWSGRSRGGCRDLPVARGVG
ncbi:protein kinase [Gemmatimonadota bacterium]